jgi:hemoglobin
MNIENKSITGFGTWACRSLPGGFGLAILLPILFMTFSLSGCGTSSTKKENQEFFTSGSREADQRASQRMAKAEQLQGSGEGAGEKGKKKAVPVESSANTTASDSTNKALQVQGKVALFNRLGGEAGISNIVVDFTARALNDPRVNWSRRDVKQGGILSVHGKSDAWYPSSDNIALLQKHFVQFLALATGGPPRYEGKDIKSSHASMHISNAEFDATIGDFKASLDKLKVPNQEQKELLAILESTRPQIVAER